MYKTPQRLSDFPKGASHENIGLSENILILTFIIYSYRAAAKRLFRRLSGFFVGRVCGGGISYDVLPSSICGKVEYLADSFCAAAWPLVFSNTGQSHVF